MVSTTRVPERALAQFIERHRLPPSYRNLIDEYLLPLAGWIASRLGKDTFFLGINGAQGTGKSTLADFIQVAMEAGLEKRVAVLSIDDFYLTKAEREELGRTVHPLLTTRGVPGTHDVSMLENCLAALRALRAKQRYRLPRFDKAMDDRADVTTWPTVTGPIDLVVLEGWCVGSTAQTAAELETPLNELEKREDLDGTWRRYVAERLLADYQAPFSKLDALVFLRAPSFDAVYRWRLQQEQMLRANQPDRMPAIMDESALHRFIQHYERITRGNLQTIPKVANVVLDLNERHDIVAGVYPE